VKGTLTLVATPIGNREDLSARARRTLLGAELVYAEDTRHTGRLLAELGAHARLRSCHDHNEAQRAEEIRGLLAGGASVVLVSDAGTPGLADPGYRVVRSALEGGFAVTMIPGPSSIVMAVVLSGLPTDRFVFDGWMARRSGPLQRQVQAWEREPRTIVALESTHRLVKTLRTIAQALPQRRMAVCRELTKVFEEVRRGLAAELAGHFEQNPPRGEMVLVVEGAQE
jgi:16S rRNA (cytidine1402-2'-O)-methyltransferase